MKTTIKFDFQQFVVGVESTKEKPEQPVVPQLRSLTPTAEDLKRYSADKAKYDERMHTYAGEVEEWKSWKNKHASLCKSSWDRFVNELIKHMELEPTPEILDTIKTFGSRTGFRRGSLERMLGTYDSMQKWKGKIKGYTYEKIQQANLGSLSSVDVEGIAIAIEQLRNASIRFIPVANTNESYALCMYLLNSENTKDEVIKVPEIVNHGKVIRLPASKFVKYLLMRIGKEPSKL